MTKTDFSICTKPDEYINDTCGYDIIGDVHGCFGLLRGLLGLLGYGVEDGLITSAPENRKLVFLGDLCDRGEDSVGCIRLVRNAAQSGLAYWILGNHDEKLCRWLRKPKEGDEARAGFLAMTETERLELSDYILTLPDHLILDSGRLIAVHGGITDELIGQQSNKCRAFALYGATTGLVDENGLPIRGDWTKDYNGEGFVVYGHDPVTAPRLSGNTLNIDTGTFESGILTAFHWPERELVSYGRLDCVHSDNSTSTVE